MCAESKESSERRVVAEVAWGIEEMCAGQSGWSLLLCLAPLVLYRALCEEPHGENAYSFSRAHEDVRAGESVTDVADRVSRSLSERDFAGDDALFLRMLADGFLERVETWAAESGFFHLETRAFLEKTAAEADGEADDDSGLACGGVVHENDHSEAGEEREAQLAAAVCCLFDFVGGLASADASTYDLVCRYCLDRCGKTGGLFSTPNGLAELIARIVSDRAVHEDVSLYDPCCGVGFVLKRCLSLLSVEHAVSVFGQDVDHDAYELCRMRAFFCLSANASWNLLEGDVLSGPWHSDVGTFDVIVSCPPTLVTWPGDSESALAEDERFVPAGCLAPRESSDLAFAMHAYHCLDEEGVAVLVLYPAPLRRGGCEEEIRRYLVERNAIEAVIQLPPNLFLDSSMAASVVILAKNRKDDGVLFVDGKRECEKGNCGNNLSQKNVSRLSRICREPKAVSSFSKVVPKDEIVANGYRLTVSDYLKEERPIIVIDKDFLKRKTEELSAQFAISHRRIDGIIR